MVWCGSFATSTVLKMACAALATIAILSSTAYGLPSTRLESLKNPRQEENTDQQHIHDTWSRGPATDKTFQMDPRLVQRGRFSLQDDIVSDKDGSVGLQDNTELEPNNVDRVGQQDKTRSDDIDRLPLTKRGRLHQAKNQNHEDEESISRLSNSQTSVKSASTAGSQSTARLDSLTNTAMQNYYQSFIDDAVVSAGVSEPRPEKRNDLESDKTREVSRSVFDTPFTSAVPSLSFNPFMVTPPSAQLRGGRREQKRINIPSTRPDVMQNGNRKSVIDVENLKIFTENDDTIDEDESHLESHIKDLRISPNKQQTTQIPSDNFLSDKNQKTVSNNDQEENLDTITGNLSAGKKQRNVGQQTQGFQNAKIRKTATPQSVSESSSKKLISHDENSPTSQTNRMMSDFTAAPYNREEDQIKQEAKSSAKRPGESEDNSHADMSSDEGQSQLVSKKPDPSKVLTDELTLLTESLNSATQNDVIQGKNTAAQNPLLKPADNPQPVQSLHTERVNANTFAQYDETLDKVEAHLISHIKDLEISLASKQQMPAKHANLEDYNSNKIQPLISKDWVKFSARPNGGKTSIPISGTGSSTLMTRATDQSGHAIEGSADEDSSTLHSSTAANSPAPKADKHLSSFIAGPHNKEDHFKQKTVSSAAKSENLESQSNIPTSQIQTSRSAAEVNGLSSPEHMQSSVGGLNQAKSESPASGVSSYEHRSKLADLMDNDLLNPSSYKSATRRATGRASGGALANERLNDNENNSAPSFANTIVVIPSSGSPDASKDKSDVGANIQDQSQQVVSQLETQNLVQSLAAKPQSLKSQAVPPTTFTGNMQADNRVSQQTSDQSNIVPEALTPAHSSSYLNQANDKQSSTIPVDRKTYSRQNLYQVLSRDAPQATFNTARVHQGLQMENLHANRRADSAQILHHAPALRWKSRGTSNLSEVGVMDSSKHLHHRHFSYHNHGIETTNTDGHRTKKFQPTSQETPSKRNQPRHSVPNTFASRKLSRRLNPHTGRHFYENQIFHHRAQRTEDSSYGEGIQPKSSTYGTSKRHRHHFTWPQ